MPSDAKVVKFKEKILQFLEDNGVSEFKQLREEYGKAANNIYTAMKIFKPARRELGTKAGESLFSGIVRKISKGEKIPSQDRALLTNLQEGFEVMGVKIEGIQPVLNNLEKRGMDMKVLSEGLKKLKTSRKQQDVFMAMFKNNLQNARESLKMSQFAKTSKIGNISAKLSAKQKLVSGTIGVAQRALESTIIGYLLIGGIQRIAGGR